MPSRAERRALARAQQSSEREQTVQQTTIAASYSGILPPPNMLAKYDEILPGLADRLVSMAERNQEHRHILERAAIQHEIRASDRGQLCALAVALAGIGGGAYIAHLGQTIAGTGVIGGVIATIATAYFATLRSRRKEREKKAELMAGQLQG